MNILHKKQPQPFNIRGFLAWIPPNNTFKMKHFIVKHLICMQPQIVHVTFQYFIIVQDAGSKFGSS